MRATTRLAAAAMLCACATAEQAGPDAPAGEPDAAPIDGADLDAEPDGPPADASPIDATLEARTILHDTGGDFTGAAGALAGATVEPWGAVAPVAYYTGGLLHRASDTGYFTNATTATWADVQQFPTTGKAAIAWTTQASWGTRTPPSVGLTDGDFWTQWYEGELWLEQGSWTFTLLVDDHGFVELAPPGSTSFARIVSANWPTQASGVYNAAATGWHPFRMAIAEQQVDASVDLRISGPGVPAQGIPRHRMRARADQLAGLVQVGFDDFRGVGDHATTIDAVTPGNTNWNTGNPGDLAMTSADEFSVRWAGQVRIDAGGAYALRYVTDDGQRLWVNGVPLLDAWDGVTHDQTTAAIDLAPGWHDLVIEHTEYLGGALASLTVAAGPELVGQAFPLDRLRPVEGRARRIAPGVDHADRAIPDLGMAESQVTLRAPAGATAAGIDVTYQLTHTWWGDLEVRLIAPDGTAHLLRPRSGGSTSGVLTERHHVTALDGRIVDGTWTLRVSDHAGADTGTLLDLAITVHHAGGEPPIPATATFDSAPLDLGTVASIDAIDWAARVPPGAAVQVRARTCDQPAGCAQAAWSEPVPQGGAPAVTPARHLQYRIELTSGGDRAAAVEWIRIDYTAAL